MEVSRTHFSKPQPLLEVAYPSLVRSAMRYLTTAPLPEKALVAYSASFEGDEGKCRGHASQSKSIDRAISLIYDDVII